MKKRKKREDLSILRSISDYVRTNDIPNIKRLHKRFFPRDILPKIDDNNTYWFFLVNNKVSGFCILRIIEPKSIAFLCRSGVEKRYSGYGVQKRMIRIREIYARRQGIKRMITYTSPDNYRSISNLIKSDYQLYRPDWQYAGPEELYFLKDL